MTSVACTNLRPRNFIFSFACTLALFTTAAQALETTTPERKLGGHTFMPSQIVDQPFITREYSMTTGVGFTTIDIGDDSFDFASFGLESNVQQPLTDRFAVDFDFAGVILAGVDGDSAFILGANAEWDIGGGVSYNVMKDDDHSVTVTADLSGGQGYLVSPGAAIQVAVDEADLTTSGLLTQTKNFGLGFGATGAYGISSTFGVYGATGYAFDHANPDRGSSDDVHTFEVGFGGSVDFNETGLPIGLSLGYLLEQEMNADTDTSSSLEFGVLYAPNDHFAFGFSVLGNIIDFKGDSDLQTWSGTFGLVYYE